MRKGWLASGLILYGLVVGRPINDVVMHGIFLGVAVAILVFGIQRAFDATD